AALDEDARRTRLADAVSDAGWLELRDDAGDRQPLTGGAEAAIVAEALGAAVADVAFTGPVLARDLLRRGGLPPTAAATAYASALDAAAIVDGAATSEPAYAIDAETADNHAIVLVPASAGFRLGQVPVARTERGTDLTRT